MGYEQKMKREDFREFYKKYFRFSISIANEIVKNIDTAQDIAQEVFCSLFQQSKNLNLKKDEKMLYGFVKRATVNKALDYRDISPDEVAREYGLTRNGVNNRIFRTKQWIEREMSRIYD